MPRVKSVRVNDPKNPVSGLFITDIPESTRLVVLIGPNGSGKTSLFDALRVAEKGSQRPQRAAEKPLWIECHDATPAALNLYMRNAYRTEYAVGVCAGLMLTPYLPEQLPRVAPSPLKPDQRVTSNFQKLLQRAYVMSANSTKTWSEAVSELFASLNKRLNSVFPYLQISDIPYPVGGNTAGSLETLCFQRSGPRYQYAALSAGEKEVFDLLFDLEMWATDYPDALYCMDEPELHLHTELQASLLEQVLDLLPERSQLWIATHSIGIIRKAMELHRMKPHEVVFLDFRDLQLSNELRPAAVNQSFWKSALRVALHDLAELVMPERVIVCEARPPGANGKKRTAAFDANVYNSIFSETHPETTFIAGGSSKQVEADAMRLLAALKLLSSEVITQKLIDRDNHNPAEIERKLLRGCRVLSRYSIENFLWSDEVITKLFKERGCESETASMLELKAKLIARPDPSREDSQEEIKKIANHLYAKAVTIPQLKGSGSSPKRFAYSALVPMITPGTTTYDDLERDIFG